jgi:hypothetical protein
MSHACLIWFVMQMKFILLNHKGINKCVGKVFYLFYVIHIMCELVFFTCSLHCIFQFVLSFWYFMCIFLEKFIVIFVTVFFNCLRYAVWKTVLFLLCKNVLIIYYWVWFRLVVISHLQYKIMILKCVLNIWFTRL